MLLLRRSLKAVALHFDEYAHCFSSGQLEKKINPIFIIYPLALLSLTQKLQTARIQPGFAK